jgi:hypothetical protein
MTTNGTRWLSCVGVALSILFQVRDVKALPSQRCETIELVERQGLSRQMGLPKLVELLKTIPLTIVPNGVPADIRLDFRFSSGTSSIHAAIRSWAETESVEVESGRVRGLDDFQARRLTILPMEEADAEAFRQQIVAELKKQVEARTAAVVLASEPEGLPVTMLPDNKAPPLNRNRTVAVLGCLRDGAELEGYVAWPDGHREPFKQRANQTPGRFVVGSPASTERPPVPESPRSTDTSAAEPEPSVAREKPERSRSTSWYWWVGAPLAIVLALMARMLIKKR